MKATILAAGQGTRLRPLTDNIPKCMVEYQNKPIIDYILDAMQECGVNDIAIVGGYKIDILKDYLKSKNITFFENKNYANSNMVTTLFCAKEWLDDDLIISYADIVYDSFILKCLIECNSEVSTTIDTKWRELWHQRMENPLLDAETLKLDQNDNIAELGKKPLSYDDIEGQYMGLIKIKKDALGRVINFYNSLDRNLKFDGKDFDNMYMTSFLQNIIDGLLPIKAVKVTGGWAEIDSVEDLKAVI